MQIKYLTLQYPSTTCLIDFFLSFLLISSISHTNRQAKLTTFPFCIFFAFSSSEADIKEEFTSWETK